MMLVPGLLLWSIARQCHPVKTAPRPFATDRRCPESRTTSLVITHAHIRTYVYACAHVFPPTPGLDCPLAYRLNTCSVTPSHRDAFHPHLVLRKSFELPVFYVRFSMRQYWVPVFTSLIWLRDPELSCSFEAFHILVFMTSSVSVIATA